MTCNEIENRLPAYREGLLSQEERKTIAEHLAFCPRCSLAFANLKKAEALVQGLGEVDPPPFFEQRIMSRVREEAGKKQGILRSLFYPLHIKIPIQALATILVAVLTIYVYQSGDPEMKQIAPLPLSQTDSAKGQVTAEAPRTLAPRSGGTMVKRAPAEDPPERNRQWFVTPPPEGSGKDERAADSRAKTREEHPSAMKPADPLTAVKETEASPVGEVALNGMRDKAGKRYTDKAFEIHPKEQKHKARMSDTGAGIGESAKAMSAPSPPRTMAAAPSKRQSVIDMTIRVSDAGEALREIQTRLGRVNARIIERQDRKESRLVTVEMAAQNVAALLDQLRAIGRIDLETIPLAAPEGDATVNIKIVTHP